MLRLDSRSAFLVDFSEPRDVTAIISKSNRLFPIEVFSSEKLN